MYLAALAASERMAAIESDGAAADRYRKIRESGSRKQDATLFDGDYYIQIPDKDAQQDYGRGCHIDQLLGQWWAHQLDLGMLYPEDHVKTALRSLFRWNFQKHFHGIRQLPRQFVADDDPGLQMITWPKGGKPAGHTQYASEVMSGFEYSAAAEMVHMGLLREGFTVLRGASIRYDGRMRKGVEAWGWNGNPFCDDECGKFYARTMSIWSVLLACQGFSGEGPAGRIGFRPVWEPGRHKSFFSAAEGWGLFSQERRAGSQVDELEVASGKLSVKELVFEVREGRKVRKVAVTAGAAEIPSSFEQSGVEVRIRLEKALTVEAGSRLTIRMDD
jgi:non-lysosomal glucosylceramidase